MCSTPQRCVGRLHFVSETCRRSFGIQGEREVRATQYLVPHGKKQHVWSACYQQMVHITPTTPHIGQKKMCSEYLHMGAMIAPYGCFDVSSVLMTSNNEAVALLACIISMVGPILKSVAGQIELGELIATCGNILIRIINCGS